MEQVVFDKALELVREGHQVMVFVHARKETVKTAQRLKEMAMEESSIDLFDNHDHPKFQLYRRDIGTSRNREMKELFDYGFGIHHAGMLRSDRTMMERMFEDNAIKVLCCTSTLAWGVNLPAHAVIIKGTNVYDSGKGAFVDLSVLDVLQIFGRAGRPGYETEGVGYICTAQDKLDHYLYSIMSQVSGLYHKCKLTTSNPLSPSSSPAWSTLSTPKYPLAPLPMSARPSRGSVTRTFSVS